MIKTFREGRAIRFIAASSAAARCVPPFLFITFTASVSFSPASHSRCFVAAGAKNKETASLAGQPAPPLSRTLWTEK